MSVNHGFDPNRDNWSIDATERLFEPIAAEVFGVKRIEYAWRSSIDRLDKQYGVDALLQTPRRNVALAIRLRSQRYYKGFGDITIRYESLQNLGKALEMQKSIARLLFYGWCDTDIPDPPTAIVDWHVIWLQRLVDDFLAGKLPYTEPRWNKDGSSTFLAFDVGLLRERKLILKSKPMPVSQAC